MKRTIFIFGCCLLGWGANHVLAQEGVIAAGGDATGAGGSASYSIGQIDYAPAGSSNYYIIQGLQQPFEISNPIGIENVKIELVAAAYPNPFKGNLTLKVETGSWDNLNYLLYDEQGKLLLSNRITQDETVLSISHLASAHYFLKVINNNQELKTFKIIKLF